MSRRRGPTIAGATVLAALLLASHPSHAYFEESATGARGVSMGGAAISLITDVSAYHWNPAGLAALEQGEVLVDFARPHGVPDLNEGAIVLGARRFGTGWAAGWHRLSIAGIYSEDLLCLAAGRTLAARRDGLALAGGATFRYGRVGFQPFDEPGTGATIGYGSQAKGDLDVGLRLTTPWRIDFAWVARDLLQPRYEFVAGSGGQLQRSHQELGVAMRWNRESTITTGWSQDAAGNSSFNTGLEIQFFDVFAVRSGITHISEIYQTYGSADDLQFVGGFGVYHRGYYVDAAATTNHDLGASYRVSLRVPIGRGGPR